VVLTNALKEWIRARAWLGPRTQIEAIPCCVDLERFRFDPSARVRLREELGLGARLVLVYSGSLGSFYREADVARFAALVKRRAVGEIRFLLLTGSSPERLVGPLEQAGLTKEEIVVRKVKPAEMYMYLSAGDLGISFITSTFSKKGSSPTKVAEYLACGLPVVLNGDIGDQAELAAEREACAVFEDFSDQALEAVAGRAVALATRQLEDRVTASRRVAEARFDVERVGVARYERLYRALA
jgi:glycosyltransferase involved in cell wall biosynthesis